MTSPVGSLSLPEPDPRPSGRPPSPLRNGFSASSSVGIDPDDLNDDDDDDRSWIQRSPSPSSSVSKMAVNFAQKVGNLVGSMGQRPPNYLPTAAELEAEAERERDRSRREAERILSREAETRRNVEDRVLEMLNTHADMHPPTRTQTMPNIPSPSGSQKESWWNAAKNRMTPTKELTPAQQVVQETKAKEKKGSKGKGKEKEQDWLSNARLNGSDPSFLGSDLGGASPSPVPRSLPGSPASPTPVRHSASMQAPNLSSSPMRSNDNLSSSPSRETPPVYAQFNSQGALDVHGTLLTIAKRFEKLEKWTVGHVRALEDRMGDVERWLVEKEKEKGEVKQASTAHSTSKQASSISADEADMIREDLSEMQSRVVEIGREMAKLATSNRNLSVNESAQSVHVSVAPQTQSSFAVHESAEEFVSSPSSSIRGLPSSTSEATTTPLRSSSSVSSRNRLPYPSGDYAPSPDGSTLPPEVISPPNSPPASLNSSRIMTMSMHTSTSDTSNAVASGASASPQSSSSLPPPRAPPQRPSSVSPTPRKRYTVALGDPIVSPPEFQASSAFTKRHNPQSSVSTTSTYFSSYSSTGSDTEGEVDEMDQETIGKRAGRVAAQRPPRSHSPAPNIRARPQSTYGYASLQQTPQPQTAPLQLRSRSRSTDKFGANMKSASQTSLNSTFVDPLLLRKEQQQQNTKTPTRKPAGKVPVGQLVAFFDQDKKEWE